MVFQPMMAGAGRGVLTGHLPYEQLLAFHTHDGSSELVVCSWMLTAAVEREQLVGRMLVPYAGLGNHAPSLLSDCQIPGGETDSRS